MTAGTGQFPPLAQWIRFAFKRMIANRMPFFNILEFIMTTNTKLIDSIVELKPIIVGMRIVANYASTPLQDTMGKKGQMVY